MSDELRDLVTFERVAEALADLYAGHFSREAGEMRIRRVTAMPPESVNEVPWLFFVADEGTVETMTFKTSLEDVPRRRRALTFGSEAVTYSTRPHLQVTHRFKAQLLVKVRQDLALDEAAARPFIEPLLLVCAQDPTLGGLVERCFPTGYRYGVLPFGRVEERAREFMGVEVLFEAVVVL